MAFYRLNEKHNGVEIVFNAKPEAETLEALKTGGFRWHRGGGYWYAVQTSERMELAEKIANGEKVDASAVDLAEYYTTATPGYMGATEITGSKYASGGWLFGKELSSAIRDALKKCNIGGCSVRVHTFSGGQEITVTVKATNADIIPMSEYYENNKHNYNAYWYTTPDGKEIHKDAMPWSDYDKCQEIIKHTLTLRYNWAVDYMSGDHGLEDHNARELLTSAFCDKLKKIQTILNAYNHDDSNGQVDYFDRHFYDDIRIKLAA